MNVLRVISKSNLLKVSLVALAAILATVVVVFVATTKPVEAAFPGKNGKIAFTRTPSAGNPSIYVMNADGSGQTNITPESIDAAYSPKWSPDGSKLVFWSITRPPEGHRVDIFVMNADGSDVTRLTHSYGGVRKWVVRQRPCMVSGRHQDCLLRRHPDPMLGCGTRVLHPRGHLRYERRWLGCNPPNQHPHAI